MLRLVMYAMLVMTVSASMAFANDEKYQHDRVYQGPYATERIYQLNPQREVYYPSSRFASLSEIACPAARYALESRGEWVGNLSNSGKCLGSVEAPEYATGNFINYRIGENDE